MYMLLLWGGWIIQLANVNQLHCSFESDLLVSNIPNRLVNIKLSKMLRVCLWKLAFNFSSQMLIWAVTRGSGLGKLLDDINICYIYLCFFFYSLAFYEFGLSYIEFIYFWAHTFLFDCARYDISDQEGNSSTFITWVHEIFNWINHV